ncbi:unnamed protein product [Prorocentrum cordatum]|uniref:Uncharacterized protein n=1 Tax=Prorocentrum cordatum TaxID=2364126 RepID=A0ABN9VG18_9DINO|nr:unnamed protein product [Polarella glacialis]
MRTVPTPTRTGTGQLPVQRAARVVHVVRVQPQQQQQQGQQQGQQQQKQLPDRGSAEVPAGKPAQGAVLRWPQWQSTLPRALQGVAAPQMFVPEPVCEVRGAYGARSRAVSCDDAGRASRAASWGRAGAGGGGVLLAPGGASAEAAPAGCSASTAAGADAAPAALPAVCRVHRGGSFQAPAGAAVVRAVPAAPQAARVPAQLWRCESTLTRAESCRGDA